MNKEIRLNHFFVSPFTLATESSLFSTVIGCRKYFTKNISSCQKQLNKILLISVFFTATENNKN
jgi:hypothetical protein